MKIVINQLEQIAGVELYPIVALLIFFTVFVLVTYMVVKTNKKDIEEYSRMPLDGNDDLQNENNRKI